MKDSTATESCQKCQRKDSLHYEGVCLECGGMMFMWYSLGGMDEPVSKVIIRRIQRIKDRLAGIDE